MESWLRAGVIPREQYEQLRVNYLSLKASAEAARSAVNSANEAIKVDAAAVEKAKVDLSYCYIRSPIEGRAGQRLVDVGNVVSPGGSGAAAILSSPVEVTRALRTAVILC